jgi:hypothetical protein
MMAWCTPDTGRSVLASRQTTCLPKYMERSAYLATVWRLGRADEESQSKAAQPMTAAEA